jgi:hypothetical protein
VKLVAAMLVAVLFVLTPLAHGSPIDPSTPGFWDNGDFDDVVLFLTSDLHFLATERPPDPRVFRTAWQSVIECPPEPVPQRAHTLATPRAPPLVNGIPVGERTARATA